MLSNNQHSTLMGLFDFLKRKKQPRVSTGAVSDQMKMVALAAFPGGAQQIEEESAQLHDLLQGKIEFNEAKQILTRVKALLVIAEDKSEKRMVPSIVTYSNGKLTEEDASRVYQFLAGASGADLYSGGDGSSRQSAVVINATSSITGIDAEYQWIEKQYGPRSQWKITGRMNGTDESGKTYETFHIECADGRRASVVFDITSFYGRF